VARIAATSSVVFDLSTVPVEPSVQTT